MASVGNADWKQYLEKREVVEKPELSLKRTHIVRGLQSLLKIFEDKERAFTNGIVECILTPFGSFGLGAYIAGADIDLVCLASAQVRRTAFFNVFPRILRDSGRTQYIEVIKRAAVPIIKCDIEPFSVDISFVQLTTSLEDIDLLDDSIFINMSEIDVASLDGPRVHRFILQHIDPEHLPVFRTCLQCIKHWAIRRCIYGKPMGYLNGGTWALLLLKVLLLPNTRPCSISDLLRLFFDTWSSWPWPKPVLMTDTIPNGAGRGADQNSMDFDEVMPIATPCHPVCSSAPYVTKSTLQVMKKELQRAKNILQASFTDPYDQMDKLFKPLDFAKKYRHFLKVTVTAQTQKSHEIWIRKMAHILPRFIQSLETCPDITQIHPLTKPFASRTEYKNDEELWALKNGWKAETSKGYATGLQPGAIYLACYIIGLEVVTLDALRKEVDLSFQIKTFLDDLETKRGKKDDDVDYAVTAIKRQEVGSLMGIL